MWSKVGRIAKLAVTKIVMKHYALVADVVCLWTNIFHCIE